MLCYILECYGASLIHLGRCLSGAAPSPFPCPRAHLFVASLHFNSNWPVLFQETVIKLFITGAANSLTFAESSCEAVLKQETRFLLVR